MKVVAVTTAILLALTQQTLASGTEWVCRSEDGYVWVCTVEAK